jgi:F0F1-type ATP synthase membrane subunit b/b'
VVYLPNEQVCYSPLPSLYSSWQILPWGFDYPLDKRVLYPQVELSLAAQSMLNSRQEGISKNLQQAEERAQEAKQRVSEAKSQLAKAQKKAVEINKQGKVTADKEKKDSVNRKKEELSRLTEKKEQILYVEEQKAVSQVYNQLVKRVMDKARNKLSGLDSQSHDSVIKYQLVMLSKYKQ